MTRRFRRMGCVAAALAVTSGLPASKARAWDDFGHMEVAAVAFGKLNAKARKRVAALLRLNPHHPDWIVGAKKVDLDRVAFMRAATWADSIKSDPAYKDDKQTDPTAAQNIGYADLFKHAYWHFVDQPLSPDGTPLIQPIAPNAATEIPLLRAALGSADTSEDLKSYDLVWLLHLVGDVHQPLHTVSRFDAGDPKGDRGGNNVKITGNVQPPVCDDPRYCPFGPPAELHAFYDDIEGSGYATAPVTAAAAALPQADAKKAKLDDSGVWVAEGLDLAKSSVYVSPVGAGDGPFAIDQRYQAAAYELGKERIALAGARLANLLNGSLGE
jgi:hypothetical protein